MAENKRGEIKDLAKMAKSRLKSGFWENYNAAVQKNLQKAESEGVSCSNVIRYYKNEVAKTVSCVQNEIDESFYRRVKELLDTVGDAGDMLGRLCDEEYMKTLTFQQKQRYLLELASRYSECKERYEREKKYASPEFTVEAIFASSAG